MIIVICSGPDIYYSSSRPRKSVLVTTSARLIKKQYCSELMAMVLRCLLIVTVSLKAIYLIDMSTKLPTGEAKSHSLLSTNELAPQLYARFNNGLLYKFIEGQPCSPDDFQRPDIFPSIARVLGRWHAVLPTTAATSGSTDNNEKSVFAPECLSNPGRLTITGNMILSSVLFQTSRCHIFGVSCRSG